MGLFNRKQKLKEKKKEEEIIQKQQDDNAKSKALYEAFKLKTMATQSKIGTYEIKVKDNENQTETVYTEYGPIEKRNVYKTFEENGQTFSDKYTVYEGYINPDEAEGKSGYFKIIHRIIYSSNPVERETFTFQDYNGFHVDANGNPNTFMHREENCKHCGEYGLIAEKFDKIIQEVKQSQKEEEENEAE